MPREKQPAELSQALVELMALRRFSGTPKEFWPRLLVALSSVSVASKATVLLKDKTETGWKIIADWSVDGDSSRLTQLFAGRLEELAAACDASSQTIVSLEAASSRSSAHFALALKLVLLTNQTCVAAFLLSEVSEPAAREALLRLSFAADVPRSYQEFLGGQQAKTDIKSFADALDLMAAVNAEKHFLAATLAFCNGLATRFACDRVSLGWLSAGYVKLQTISRTEKFDRQMAVAQLLEAAMDECLDQDEELIWPPPQDANFVARDHEKYSREHQVSHLCSLPLRVEARPVAVLTCERATPFSALEIQQLRLCCNQATQRLADLQRRDRWFGARWAAWSREQLALVIGPKHTWAKVVAVLGVLLLCALFFVRVPYRVEGNFVLKSDETQFRTAPFDGFIEQVFVRPGDLVKAGDRLLKLFTRELELEATAAQADVMRYRRESEKSRAANALAEMRVATALADQAQARLELVRYRLNEAMIKAPFDGVLIEGDLRERLAAPVKQGDGLMKLARLENLFVEAEVNERDIHEVLGREHGEIAFVSQPHLKFPVRIVKIEPAAFPRSEGNIFLVRCVFDGGLEKWWRPGMSGVCKLSIEKRTLWWTLTHRTADFLRIKLWWP